MFNKMQDLEIQSFKVLDCDNCFVLFLFLLQEYFFLDGFDDVYYIRDDRIVVFLVSRVRRIIFFFMVLDFDCWVVFLILYMNKRKVVI